ncbi:hypothetical protein M3J09_013371 [Ascochyta lentis]
MLWANIPGFASWPTADSIIAPASRQLVPHKSSQHQ